jgi:hypothetical protein
VPVLWGQDEELFRDERDLVALAPMDSDRLNEFLRNYIGWFFKVSRQSKAQNMGLTSFGVGEM